MRSLCTCALVLASSCVEGPEPFDAPSFEAQRTPAAVALLAAPGAADERGGGIFIGVDGAVVRLRSDGSRGLLESHPQNAIAPGPATAAWPLGPSTALVATSTGLFVAESGWLIAPPWQSVLSADGVVGTAVADNGVGWLAHANGLFRLEGGQLTELKVAGASVVGLTAVTAGPSVEAQPGVWFAQGDKLSNAAQLSPTEFIIRDSGLTKSELSGGVIGLAGVSAAPGTAGGVFAITPKSTFQFAVTGWRRLDQRQPPTAVRSAGRMAWLQAGGRLFRYDGDSRSWGEASGLAAGTALVGVDATGTAWVTADDGSAALSRGQTLRLQGLFHNAAVFEPQLPVSVMLPATAELSSLTYAVDAIDPRHVALEDRQPGTGPQAHLAFYSLGGAEKSGVAKPLSFAVFGDGLHTLLVAATFADGSTSTRRVPFELHGTAAAVVSFERDIRPLNEARCAKCHTTGTEPELKTYEQWQTHAEVVRNAVRDRRMPADGPMDTASIEAVSRWVSGGTKP